MDFRTPAAVPLLAGADQAQQHKAQAKRSKLLTVCPFILGVLLGYEVVELSL